jgi:UDP-3-O-[3-hydroxymyristoyl] N-acetylglucosamine deacetylase
LFSFNGSQQLSFLLDYSLQDSDKLEKVGEVQPFGFRHQRTLASSACISGAGIITSLPINLRFHPAPPDTGILFLRTDRPGQPMTPARVDQVTDTQRRTTLGPTATGITLVEHVLASLAGLRIDNCLIELDGPEPPGLDGSALGFTEALDAAGIVLQPARRVLFTIIEPLVLHQKGATIAIYPALPGDETLRISYLLDYGPQAHIPRQSFTIAVTPESFTRELAGCRTFLLESEAHQLRQQGIGRHLSASELLVFGPRGPIDNTLRFADEPARHKVLDLIGDLSLSGCDLVGHVVAYRSGHSLNVAMAQALAALKTRMISEGLKAKLAERGTLLRCKSA